MLGLLITNCGKSNLIKGLQNVPRIQSNFTTAREFHKIKLHRNCGRTVVKNGRNGKAMTTRQGLLVAAGSGISLGIIAKSRASGFLVDCEANRLAGVLSKSLEQPDGKFDWRKFWSYLQPHVWELLGAVLAALAVAFLNIRIPNLLGDLVNILAKYANTFVKDPLSNTFLSDVKAPAANLFGCYLLQSCFTFIYILLLSRIGEQMSTKIRQDLFKQIIVQDIEFFDENRTGELVNRLTADVQDFKSSFKQFIAQGLRSGAQLIGGAISLFLISPHMAAIALASVPAVVTFMTFLGKTLRSLSKNAQAQSERATAVCEEALSNIRTVRSSACEFREAELFEEETNEAAVLAQKLGYGIAVFQGLTNFFLNSLVLTTLFLGGHLMSTESLSPGQLMAFLVASQGVQRSLAQGSVLLGTMIRGMTAGTRVFEYLAIEPKIDILKGYKIPAERLHGEIRFENVSFAYPARPDHIVLKNFSLTLRPGETVALVGASGSGKSTIAALVERFYEPSSGTIRIDGYQLSDISPHWLRGEVLGFIEQQPVLFATTIYENIRYGRPDATEEEVHEVAKMSQSHDFVSALPDSYGTNVGERGAQLSGGQRQRIAIARALLKNPKVLILDEATSALDATSEAVVQKALDTAVLNRTTLVIAHRLSTIRNADLIVVLDQGQIVEAALAVAFLNIRIPNLLGDLVNILAKYANTFVKDPLSNTFLSDVKAPAANLFGCYLLQSCFTFIYILLLSRIGEQMSTKIRQDLFKQIIVQDIEFFDENRTGELVNRLTADVQDFKSSFKQFIAQGLRSGAQLIGGAISLFLISPHMAAIALASVPAVVTFMTFLGKTLRSLSKNAQAQSERATAVCEEALSNIRTVRSSACEFREAELFEEETNEAAVLAQKLGYGIAVFQGLTNFFLNSLVLTTLFLGGHLMSTESLSPGQLMAFLVASQGVQRSLAQGSVLLGTMIRGMTAGTRVFEYLAIEPKIDILKGYKIPAERLHGEIRFENVSFAYPARPDHIVLKNFSLTLRPGETVALVGASGSGKSTIAALVERFYELSSGTIRIDGYQLSDISPHWLRGEVLGFIEQQPVLFATTIYENIRYGRPDATEEEVHEVAKMSQSHDFVSALPDSYGTNVGERGAQLSGGQRQRIAIARALLKNPKVLILDEATSALDATSEAVVQKALDTAVLNRTTLVIAHRLSTIRNADLIVVLDQGQIVESGKHDELMVKMGLYYELVRQQEKKDVKQSASTVEPEILKDTPLEPIRPKTAQG